MKSACKEMYIHYFTTVELLNAMQLKLIMKLYFELSAKLLMLYINIYLHPTEHLNRARDYVINTHIYLYLYSMFSNLYVHLLTH